MAAAIPWDELREASGRRLRVLDPMTGSGTTLAVARALGHQALGFDTDPLAVLISRAWCEDVDATGLRIVAKRVLERAKTIEKTARGLDTYPRLADDETRDFIDYWFDRRNRRELTALSTAILRVRSESHRVLLQCAFSRLIIAKQAGASLALDLAHSRPHRVDHKPTIVRPLSSFLEQVEWICRTAPFDGELKVPTVRVAQGDARALPLEDGSVDVVVTSPPYLNGIDYQRTTKFSLVWFGHSVKELRRVRSENVGTEVGGSLSDLSTVQKTALRSMASIGRLPERTTRMLARYVCDMQLAIREIARVLAPGGRAVVVIGDSSIRSNYVRNSRALLALAIDAGLEIVRVKRRPLPPNRRYLPPPRRREEQLDSRLRSEAVLHLRKPNELRVSPPCATSLERGPSP